MKISIKAKGEYHIFFVADDYEVRDGFFAVNNDGKYTLVPLHCVDYIEIDPKWENDAQ